MSTQKVFKRIRKLGAFVWVCRHPQVQEYVHELVMTLKEPIQRQVVSKIAVLVVRRLALETDSENEAELISVVLFKFEDLWRAQRVGQMLLKSFNDAQQTTGEHRSAGDDSDFQQCFYSERALLVQSFQSAISKLETREPIVCGSNAPTNGKRNAENRNREGTERRTFQVCIETWDALNKEGADASTSFKEATGWVGSLFTSETGTHEDRQIALSREKLQLDWMPMHKEKETLDLCEDDEAMSECIVQTITDVVVTIRGGGITSDALGIPIIQVAICTMMARQEKADIIEALSEVSDILRCGLDRRAIELLLALADQGGLNAEALASIVLGLREECIRVQAVESHERDARRNHRLNGV